MDQQQDKLYRPEPGWKVFNIRMKAADNPSQKEATHPQDEGRVWFNNFHELASCRPEDWKEYPAEDFEIDEALATAMRVGSLPGNNEGVIISAYPIVALYNTGGEHILIKFVGKMVNYVREKTPTLT